MLDILTQPQLCRLPDILPGPGHAGVQLYDHHGDATPGRTLVVFSQYALAVVLEGGKCLIDGSQVQSITAGDVVLYRPGNVLSTSIADNDPHYRSLIIFFSAAVLRAFLDKYAAAPADHMLDGAFRNFGHHPAISIPARAIAQGIDAGRPPSPAMTALHLEQMLLALSEAVGPGTLAALESRAAPRIGARLHQVVESHWHRNLGLEDLAFLCGMSLSTFKRAFRQHYGQAPGIWLRERRLRHAGHLLVAEGRGAAEVSELVGYANHSVFSQSFKKRFGLSPSAYQSAAPGG